MPLIGHTETSRQLAGLSVHTCQRSATYHGGPIKPVFKPSSDRRAGIVAYAIPGAQIILLLAIGCILGNFLGTFLDTFSFSVSRTNEQIQSLRVPSPVRALCTCTSYFELNASA